jgi:hypothetical protein
MARPNEVLSATPHRKLTFAHYGGRHPLEEARQRMHDNLLNQALDRVHSTIGNLDGGARPTQSLLPAHVAPHQGPGDNLGAGQMPSQQPSPIHPPISMGFGQGSPMPGGFQPGLGLPSRTTGFNPDGLAGGGPRPGGLVPLAPGVFLHTGTGQIHGFGPGGNPIPLTGIHGFGPGSQAPSAPMLPPTLGR